MNTLKLFTAAAAEMVCTRKARVASQAVFSGSVMTGVLAALGYADYVSIGISYTIGTGAGQALWETGKIYNRLKHAQFSNG